MINALNSVNQILGVTRVDGELQATAIDIAGGTLQGNGLVDANLTATDSAIMTVVTAPLTNGASPASPKSSRVSKIKGCPKTNGMWL